MHFCNKSASKRAKSSIQYVKICITIKKEVLNIILKFKKNLPLILRKKCDLHFTKNYMKNIKKYYEI